MKRTIAVAVVVFSALAAGCGPSREETLKQLRTDDPRVQTDTIARVALAGDKSMAGELINLLDSEDEGVRFMAAVGLHRLTGKGSGIIFITEPGKRAACVREWREWWQAEQQASAAGKAPAGASAKP
jgi:hypothetical protein